MSNLRGDGKSGRAANATETEIGLIAFAATGQRRNRKRGIALRCVLPGGEKQGIIPHISIAVISAQDQLSTTGKSDGTSRVGIDALGFFCHGIYGMMLLYI